jgi:hypothetical protein
MTGIPAGDGEGERLFHGGGDVRDREQSVPYGPVGSDDEDEALGFALALVTG